MSVTHYLGSSCARLVLYLPHRPEGLEGFQHAPSAQAIIAANSNHWRKIITLLAKVACPSASDWRRFRDEQLFAETALCFSPELRPEECWHWIAGQANLQRFTGFECLPPALGDDPVIAVDASRKLLLSPYPDYRQLSNARVVRIREQLALSGFFGMEIP